MTNRLTLFFLIIPSILLSQTITGKVIDKVTQEPVETASIYFDQTTIGTTTNENGEFSIDYTDAVRSNLVISYLGYQKVLIADYRGLDNILIELEAATNTLDEVFVNFDDELTREQKLKLFKKEFLGTSRFANSCKLLNEDKLVLYYDGKDNTLYASSEEPLRVKNRALQYQIEFDIIDFEASYRNVDIEENTFILNSVTYLGTTFYKDLTNGSKRRVNKNRNKVYKGSVQHFIRALYNEDLKKESYQIYNRNKKVEEWDFIRISEVKTSGIKELRLKSKINILYKKSSQSTMELKTDYIFIDVYGNYSPIIGVYLTGYLGSQRLGDTLPSDFGLDK
ncbi:carboxypeptidase-like regulatory domain-containing protein [Winogradskyella vincentii]|uniref:Carboxypeptidase-like regulatory domain-containing protein n=1 Tax=Winogradskyella vincentii TaxID=2877122 RepID=A0ABS7Y1Q5_9FLAO|nr:carboxypeptidase-like regulatory domain-containing protein [Winogradskyella vincentii]MCA0152582.1 carboxypeptidase-like regulatory domain-containing protein [Winogradskyella vincentii]